MLEMPTVYRCDCPTARKEHKCCECRGVISTGEKYHYHHGIWDGRGDSFKVCADCEALRSECDKDEHDLEFQTGLGMLLESVFESRDPVLIKRFMETKRKRGAAILPWMVQREAELQVGTEASKGNEGGS